MIVVASKIEIANPDKLKKLKAMAKRKKLPFFALSAVTGEGIEEFKFEIARQIRKLRPANATEKPAAPKKIKKVAPPASGKMARPEPVTKKRSSKRSAAPAKKNLKKPAKAIA